MLLSDWEDLLDKKEYALVHASLQAGIKGLKKYYRKSDDTSAYFISHGRCFVFYIWWMIWLIMTYF